MVTTRRKSGTVSKAASSKILEEDEADYDVSSDQESGDYSDDDDDDFNARKSTAKPSAKRQKTTASTKAGKGKAGQAAKPARRRKDLSLLPTMPLDILFEIFGQLSPKDLISLSLTNKLFRETLLASNATTVWKGSREEYDAPEPPRDFTEPQWAALLFLTSCRSCGAKGVPKVDWFLRKRVCTSCKKTHGKFKSRFPDYEPEVLNYVTFTHTGGWSHGHKTNSKYYWDDDIHPIVEQWRTLNHAAHLGQAGAKGLFENWKKQRAEHLEYIAKMAPTYETWYQNMSSIKNYDAVDNRKKRLAAVKAKFLELGYDTVDINSALSVHTNGIHTGIPDVTNAVWSRLRPKLEPRVQAKRNQRVAQELESTMKQRMSILEGLYNDYLFSLKPSDRVFCPPVLFLRPLPEVVKLIEAAKDVVIAMGDFQPILNKLASHIADYHAERRRTTICTLPDTEKQAADPFSLAKNVFQCDFSHNSYSNYSPFKDILSGWLMISGHFCVKHAALDHRPGIRLDRPCKVAYSEKYSAVASGIIAATGLDPSTTSFADMDRKDARFICNFCCSFQAPKNVLTWRGALFHATSHSTIKAMFSIAPDALAAEAKSAAASIRCSALAWSCNHCHSFIGKADAKTRDYIFEHLKTQHAVPNPVIARDYFVNEQCRRLLEAPYVLPAPVRSNAPTFQCIECPSGSAANRRFIESGVRSHLKDKHKVTNPVAGVHFKNHAT